MYKLSSNLNDFNKEQSFENTNQKCIKDIIESCLHNNYDGVQINKILASYNIESIEQLKLYAMDYLLSYANNILDDNIITDSEYYDFSFLKKIFRINEGEFMQHKNFAIREILQQQFLRLYSDNYISHDEAIQSVQLQGLFDLSYDEFETLKKDEIIMALLEGANPEDLDISSLPKGFKL
ncbi:hypothetical protein I6H88_19595 [Elizabethkingia bruuniana]|uniref:Uncharacterized protein n=1 Tax=Elizabethkingia bruuniana TaxID=1756149 RepID=A0A7T7ZXC3_9FLAO|nr:hypothetical protein [Elizabethkingia bruuniana]AJW62334.1 hypothetical protein VO54_00848 [Elizabethkingia miricola]AQX85111.1 hypothetical protein AYC65_08875 [Elizabethkingia bruuniana]KUY28702.1 hypothetical protein ATB97_00795 [Elizabethkingia bruuniana]OPB70332.1 hypothetical protein BAY12_16905 [Elizabethkingia bruuniana]OPC59266.1 hypothetical protein BAY07_03095 [Elizabethkingia bruuniana]